MIEEKYRLPVLWKDQQFPVKTYHGPISATSAGAADIDAYCDVLIQEFMLYPLGVIERSRLKRIVLCRDLAFDGQLRAAVPDFEHFTLYLDVLRGAYNRNYQRHVIHHEFFHIIDYQDDGELYADARWAQLNAGSFRYGRGGAAVQDDALGSLMSNVPGFLTTYATAGVEEDKAELFAYMMISYRAVEKRAAGDRVIRAKLSQMKALLAQFSPDANEAFWDSVTRR
jgi:hypothetical protein